MSIPIPRQGLRLQLIVVTGCLLALVALIATSSSQLRYDEQGNLELAYLVVKNGWLHALLSPENPSNAGPLYAAIHLTVSPITHLQPPAIRWVNFYCFLCVVVLLASHKQTEPLGTRLLSACTLLAVPFLWPAAGMALTELPALVFFTGFILLFLRLIDSELELSRKAFGLALAAGFCLGIAILGRQTYLVVLPVLVMMIFWVRGKSPAVLVCIITALAICGWLFALWHGLNPPHYRQPDSSLSLANLLLSLSYAAAATLFLNPGWLARQRPIVWIICTICGSTLACFARNYGDPPAKSLLIHAFGMQLGLLIGFVIGCALAAIGAVWAWTSFQTFWRERRDPGQVFLLMSLAALVLTPMKITWQFSSRYVVGALGVLYLIIDAPCQSPRYRAARMIFGSILGMAILWSYYRQG